MGDRIADNKLIPEMKRTLQDISERDPSWRMFCVDGNFTAEQIIHRMDNDKGFRKVVLQQFVGLTVELLHRGRTRPNDLDTGAPPI